MESFWSFCLHIQVLLYPLHDWLKFWNRVIFEEMTLIDYSHMFGRVCVSLKLQLRWNLIFNFYCHLDLDHLGFWSSSSSRYIFLLFFISQPTYRWDTRIFCGTFHFPSLADNGSDRATQWLHQQQQMLFNWSILGSNTWIFFFPWVLIQSILSFRTI